MRWDAFERECPQLADIARRRFSADELVMLGTIRADGSPRVSPCEVDVAMGRLLFGMIWQSRKALDLMRDSRIMVVSVPGGRMNPGGDVKLSGRVVDESDPGVREAYRKTAFARIGWAPAEPEYHLFSLDVQEASFVRFGDVAVVFAWDEAGGFRELRHPDAPPADESLNPPS